MHPWRDLPSSPLASSPASQGLLSRRVSQMRLSPVRPDQPGLSSEPQAPPMRALVQAHVPASPSLTSPRGPLRCACLTEPGGGTGILAFQSGARGLVHGTSLGRTPLSRGLKGPPPHVELFPESSSSWDRMCGQDFLGHTGIGRDAGLIGPPTHAVSLAPLRLEGIRGPRNRHVLSSLF